jgi:hypothetical protein
MANRSYNYRRYQRYIKGMRRLRADRAEHGDAFWVNSRGEAQITCACFEPDAGHGKGAIFARFADYPKDCSCAGCDWNTKDWEKDHPNKIPLGLEED